MLIISRLILNLPLEPDAEVGDAEWAGNAHVRRCKSSELIVGEAIHILIYFAVGMTTANQFQWPPASECALYAGLLGFSCLMSKST